MTAKSQFVSSDAGLNNNDDEILPPRRSGSTMGAVGSSQLDSRDKDGPSNRNSPVEPQDPDVVAKLELTRLEYERQRNMKRELFEQQMQQLEIQQRQEEQAMLAGNKKSSGPTPNTSSDLSQTLATIRSLPVSRRNSNDAADLWSEMDMMSLGDKPKRPIDLAKIGRSGTSRTETTTSPSESAFSDSTHLFPDSRFFLDDDASTTTTSSSSRINLPRSIWNDDQGLGASYLHYLGADDDEFPTMPPSSSSSELSQNTHRHHSVHDLSRASEWPQFNKVTNNDRLPPVSQHGSGIIGFISSTTTKSDE
ncbi:hypothetical protein BGX31_003876, partial [Mortierella sp. GBA43]